jgi:fimbrial chaperone protein
MFRFTLPGRSFLACLVSSLASLFLVGAAHAGNISVFPVRAFLDSAKANEVFTVRNNGSEPVTVQASLLKWSQADGKEVLEPTRDVLVAPAVITIPAGEAQIVRVANRKAPDATQETSYRLLVQEVPRQEAAKPGQLNVLLNLSIPLFVSPTSGPPKPNLQSNGVAIANAGGKSEMQVRLSNLGSGHIQVLGVQINDGTDRLGALNGMFYILPGQARVVGIPADKVPGAGKGLRLEIKTPSGSQGLDTNVN